jgi:membrane-associated protease RseP (regulator of RpoE activity)
MQESEDTMKLGKWIWLAALVPAIALADPDRNQQDQQNKQGTEDVETETFEWTSGHARLGLMVMGLTPELRAHFGAPRDAGLLVARVQPNGPAARAGVRVGDVITKIDNERIQDAADIMSALPADATARRSLTVEVIRDHSQLQLQTAIGQRKQATQSRQEPGDEI